MTTVATDKQMNFIDTLVRQITEATGTAPLYGDVTAMTRKEVSATIDMLKAQRDAAWAQQRTARRVVRDAEIITKEATLTVGVYMREGTPIRVYPAQNSGRLLAKKLVVSADGDGEWLYMGMAHRFATADMAMTVDEAKAFGANFGVCACCGRLLSDPASIELGIGPVCAKKHF